jgi:hypothetical protein
MPYQLLHWLICLQFDLYLKKRTIFSHHLLNNVDAGFALHVCTPDWLAPIFCL